MANKNKLLYKIDICINQILLYYFKYKIVTENANFDKIF